jgi:hypothetical protein
MCRAELNAEACRPSGDAIRGVPAASEVPPHGGHPCRNPTGPAENQSAR